MKKNMRPSYFKCAFYGLLPLFLGEFCYLVMEFSNIATAGISLGILGEVAAYRFVATADVSLIVKEESEQKKHFSIAGSICSFAGQALLVVPLVLNFSAKNLVITLLYEAGICPTLYFAGEVCVNRFHNPFKDAVKWFNLFVILHIYATALFNLAPILPDGVGNITILVCAAVWAVSGGFAMILLKKGLEPWEI